MNTSLIDALRVEYGEYCQWTLGNACNPMPFAEWYEQRDYDEDEPEIEPEDWRESVARDAATLAFR